MSENRSETSLLIVFIDLTRASAQSLRVSDVELADTFDSFYEEVGNAVRTTGGTVVKFMGDAALLVFSEDCVDRAVSMLLELKGSVDRLMASRNWESRLIAKVHFGSALAGQYGAKGQKRFDVIGRDVHIAAMMESGGITLSVAAFRKLSPEMRKHFKKHTPPITYLRAEDPRPFRWRRGKPIYP